MHKLNIRLLEKNNLIKDQSKGKSYSAKTYTLVFV